MLVDGWGVIVLLLWDSGCESDGLLLLLLREYARYLVLVMLLMLGLLLLSMMARGQHW